MRKILFNEKENLFKIQTGVDFQSTFTKYYPKLVYYVNKMCRDEQVAEDISMDAFMMSLDKIQKYDKTKSQFSTWLFTIAKNITLQDIKHSLGPIFEPDKKFNTTAHKKIIINACPVTSTLYS